MLYARSAAALRSLTSAGHACSRAGGGCGARSRLSPVAGSVGSLRADCPDRAAARLHSSSVHRPGLRQRLPAGTTLQAAADSGGGGDGEHRAELLHVPDARWFSMHRDRDGEKVESVDSGADDTGATEAQADGSGDGTAASSQNSPSDGPDAPVGRFGLPKGMVRSVSILTGSQFIITAGFGVIIPVLPMLSAQFGLGASGIGMLIAAPSMMRVLLNMPMGQLADRVGRKPLMVLGTLASGLGGVGTGLTTSLATMLPMRALVGAGSAASMAGSSAYMADLTARVPQHRAKLLGVQQTVIMCSFVAGPAIGGYLATAWGPQMAFVAVGSLAGLCSLGYSLLPETLQNRKPLFGGAKPANETAAAGVNGAAPAAAGGKAAAEGGQGVLASWLKLLRDPNQQAIIAMNSSMFLIYGAELTVVPLHAQMVWDASPAQIGAMFSAVSLLGLLGAPLGGWLADKVGRKLAIVPPAVMACGGLAALTLATTHNNFIACMCVIGLGTSMLSPGLSAFAADVAPDDQRGQALSVGRQAGDITFAVAPLALGFLADWGTNGMSLVAATAMALVGTTLFAWRARVPSHSHFTTTQPQGAHVVDEVEVPAAADAIRSTPIDVDSVDVDGRGSTSVTSKLPGSKGDRAGDQRQ